MSRDKFHVTWSTRKHFANIRKHGVTFDAATSVLYDPLSMSREDDEHGSTEQRWVTTGHTAEGDMLVVVHTLVEIDDEHVHAHIISARHATRDERWQHESGEYRIREPRPMKDQYDFTGAERGKFYREGAVFVIGLEMEPALSRRLTAAAMRKDITTTELLDQMLQREEEEAAATAAT